MEDLDNVANVRQRLQWVQLLIDINSKDTVLVVKGPIVHILCSLDESSYSGDNRILLRG